MASQYRGDMGAEAIKPKPPEGDSTRGMGPAALTFPWRPR